MQEDTSNLLTLDGSISSILRFQKCCFVWSEWKHDSSPGPDSIKLVLRRLYAGPLLQTAALSVRTMSCSVQSFRTGGTNQWRRYSVVLQHPQPRRKCINPWEDMFVGYCVYSAMLVWLTLKTMLVVGWTFRTCFRGCDQNPSNVFASDWHFTLFKCPSRSRF